MKNKLLLARFYLTITIALAIFSNDIMAQSISTTLESMDRHKVIDTKHSSINNMLTENNDIAEQDLEQIMEYIKATKSRCYPDSDTITFSLAGEGGLRNNLLNKADNSMVANGTVSAGFIKKNTDLNVAFSIADIAVKEVTSSNFLGAALLAPGLEKNSFSMRYNHFLRQDSAKKKRRTSFNIYILTSADKWSIDSTEYTANIFAANASFSWHPYSIKIDKENTARLWFDLGFNYRRLFGEIIDEDNDDIRQSTFNTKNTRYFGIEPAVNLAIGKTVFFMRSPYYFRKENITVKGLSGFQLQIGASVHANFLTFKRKDSRD